MGSALQYCIRHKLISPPKWIESSLIYEAITGSVAYGISQTGSDEDIYGICIPSKSIVFPHTNGFICCYRNYYNQKLRV